jgi:hypothetical protein
MKTYGWTIWMSAGGMWYAGYNGSLSGFLLFLAVFTLATAGIYRLHVKGETQ